MQKEKVSSIFLSHFVMISSINGLPGNYSIFNYQALFKLAILDACIFMSPKLVSDGNHLNLNVTTSKSSPIESESMKRSTHHSNTLLYFVVI